MKQSCGGLYCAVFRVGHIYSITTGINFIVSSI